MKLIDEELSEPYSIFTYRYFLSQWPFLCHLAISDTEEAFGCIIGKMDRHRNGRMRGYIGMLTVKKEYRHLGVGMSQYCCTCPMMMMMHIYVYIYREYISQRMYSRNDQTRLRRNSTRGRGHKYGGPQALPEPRLHSRQTPSAVLLERKRCISAQTTHTTINAR